MAVLMFPFRPGTAQNFHLDRQICLRYADDAGMPAGSGRCSIAYIHTYIAWQPSWCTICVRTHVAVANNTAEGLQRVIALYVSVRKDRQLLLIADAASTKLQKNGASLKTSLKFSDRVGHTVRIKNIYPKLVEITVHVSSHKVELTPLHIQLAKRKKNGPEFRCDMHAWHIDSSMPTKTSKKCLYYWEFWWGLDIR